MAKRRRHRRSSGAIVRHGGGRARSFVRSAARGLSQEKHRTGAFIVAAGLGLAKAKDIKIPHLETVGEAGSIAIGAYLAKKFMGIRSPYLDHTITAAGVIAIFEATSTGNIPFLHEGKKGAKTEGEYEVD